MDQPLNPGIKLNEDTKTGDFRNFTFYDITGGIAGSDIIPGIVRQLLGPQ